MLLTIVSPNNEANINMKENEENFSSKPKFSLIIKRK